MKPLHQSHAVSAIDPLATVTVTSALLAAFLWLIDSLFVYLWLQNGQGPVLPAFWPVHDPHELLMRGIYCSVLVCTGIVLGGTLRRLQRHQRETARIAENLRITLNSIGDAVIATDTQGRVTRMNPVAETLCGWPLENASQRPLAEVFRIVNAQTGQEALNPVKQVLETGQIVGLANDTILIARDGQEHQIADSAAPIRDSTGATLGVVLVFRDVTEEYRIHREMEHAKALLQAVVEQSHVPMALVIAADQRIHLVNQACLDFLGVPEEQFTGKFLQDIDWSWKCFNADGVVVPPEATPLALALRGEATHGLEMTIEDRAGNVRSTVAEGVPIRDRSGTVIAGLVVLPDTTEHKRMEEERGKLQRLESIGTLAGGIAHDFNNILMGVFGGIELAMMTLPAEHESRKYIDTAHQALNRATHLTKQLLTFAKGGDPLLESINLTGLLKDAVEFNLSGANVKAHLDLAAGLWPIRADRGQITHVLANLIINAKQAMPEGGNLYLAADNLAHAEGEVPPLSGEHVKIVLRDEGVGISEKFIARIFDPYFSTKQSGSGLGLAIVHSIVSKHNGQIRVESTPDVGTTFTLYLPAARGSGNPEAPWYATVVSGDTQRGRVLVMDDEALVREVASDMLGLLGYEAETAAHGDEALERYFAAAASGRPFACVIMDLTIPGQMGGREAVAKLLARAPQARVIVASGYSTDPVMAGYASHGFRGRLAKPFQVHDLRQELARVLGN